MRHFNVLGVLVITFTLCGTSFANDQVNCAHELNENDAIYNLLATVKNDVLGTVPKFCREGAPQQLSEQVDSGEKELSEFVSKLKTLNSTSADTTRLNFSDEEEVQKVVFDTMKMMVLKKMWLQSSTDNQYSMIISNECESLGLNRFPLSEPSKKSEEAIESNKKLALKRAFNACQASTFYEIAPYLTKDVLAEGLLNLKNIYPKSFPRLVDSLCLDLSKNDDLIFKDDNYAEFSKGSVSINSAKEFSGWLKSIYSDISNKDSNDKKIMDQKDFISKAVEEAKESKYKEFSGNNKGASSKDSGSASAFSITLSKDYQAKLKKKFDAFTTDGKTASFPEDDADGYGEYSIKLINGVYIIGDSEEKLKQEAQDKADALAAKNLALNDFIQERKQSLEEVFEKAYAKNKKLKEVPDPEHKGFVIVKADDGSYYSRPTEKTISLVKILMKQEDKNLKMAETQGMYKKMYENQLANKDLSNASDSIIVLGTDGLYRKVYKGADSENESHKKVLEEIGGHGKSSIVPGDSSSIIIYKTGDGEYKSVDVIPTGADEYSGPFGKVSLRNVDFEINSYVVQKYQSKSADNSKLKNLTAKEVSEIQDYTANGYEQINKCLRKGNCPQEEKDKVNAIVSGLKKVKNSSSNESQIFFRGTSQLPDFIQKSLDKESDSFVLDKGFMSTTGDVGIAKKFSKKYSDDGKDSVVFIMKTKSCVGISTISHFGNGEDEFLCPPGMKFKARKKKDAQGVYILEEVSE